MTDSAFGPSAGCTYGHPDHPCAIAHVDLTNHKVPDYPKFDAGRFGWKFQLFIYRWPKYDGLTNYCPGKDEVSRSIGLNGIWEGFETLLFLAALEKAGPGVVYDFGAHIGWYTTLAAFEKRDVCSWEADPTHAETLIDNIRLNSIGDQVTLMGTLAPLSPPAQVQPVALLKIDIEGAEDEAIEACRPLLEQRLVEFILIEASPCFADYYPEMIARIMGYGYGCAMVPDKGFGSMESFEEDPVGFVQRRELGLDMMRTLLASTNQVNLFMWRK